MSWTPAEIGSLEGRTALVTGPTKGGLGFHTALELARAGAHVVLAGRTDSKLAEAEQAVLDQVVGAQLSRLVVDLASLDSVRSAAGRFSDTGPLHLLVNNAGIMATPYARTPDGFESQIGTNHFGPFLLTGLLLPQLEASGDARVVTVSSQMHRVAVKPPLHDPTVRRRPYLRWESYAESKLANLLFTYELDRRLRAADLPVKALAAHPGFAGTHLVVNGRFGRSSGGIASILDAAVKGISQPADRGAWPSLMAATADLPGSTYVGPSGPGEGSGPPKVVQSRRLARDESVARRLWEISEQATDIRYP